MAERIKIEKLHAGYRLLAYPHRSVVVQARDLLDIMDFALKHAEQLRQEARAAEEMDLKSKGVENK